MMHPRIPLTQTARCCLASVAFAILFTGCSSPWKFDGDWSKLGFGEESEFAEPDRVLAIWSDTILHRKSQPAIRGFGGRLLMYGGEGSDPIKVDGSITVYAFDAESNATVPEKKFVFPADTLTRLHSKCSLGHSYSIWLPWDQVGGPTRQVSLVVRFEGTEGGVVMSDPAKKMLPGVATQIATPTISQSTSKVQRASYEEVGQATPSVAGIGPAEPRQLHPELIGGFGQQSIDKVTYGQIGGDSRLDTGLNAANQTDAPPGIATHTIELPRSFSERLGKAAHQNASYQHELAQNATIKNGSAALGSAQSPVGSSVALGSAAVAPGSQSRTGWPAATTGESYLGSQTKESFDRSRTGTGSETNSASGFVGLNRSGSQPDPPPAPFSTSARPTGPVWPSRPSPISRQYDRSAQR